MTIASIASIEQKNPLMTREESAEYLRLSTDTLDKMRASNELVSVKVSKKRVCFLKSDLDDFLQSRRA